MPPAHRDLLANDLPNLEIALPAEGQQLDPRSLFPPAISEVWLEIGFGAGEHLIGRALAHSEVGFIGCEAYVNGVASLLSKVRQFGVGRVRVFPNDFCLLLKHLRTASVSQIFILFSDPWPKRRHHRRRVIRPDTLASLARVLIPGGELLFATDDMDYARWTLALFTGDCSWRWRARGARDWRIQPPGWVATRYQEKALARNAQCVFLRFQRHVTLEPEEQTKETCACT